MSIARIVGQIAGCLVALVIVIAVYNFGAYALVHHALSHAPPFPTTKLETSFELREFKGFGDDFLYKPGRFGDR